LKGEVFMNIDRIVMSFAPNCLKLQPLQKT